MEMLTDMHADHVMWYMYKKSNELSRFLRYNHTEKPEAMGSNAKAKANTSPVFQGFTSKNNSKS